MIPRRPYCDLADNQVWAVISHQAHPGSFAIVHQVDQGHRGDGVPGLIPESRYVGGGFGPPLKDIPGFTELSAYSGSGMSGTLGDGDWHERAYGHSEYARFGDNGELRMSGYNMAAILAGLPQDTIAPPVNPPQPYIVGPHGAIPNPSYHP